MANETNAANAQGATTANPKQYQIRTKNGDFVNEQDLPKVRKIVRVVALKRYNETQSKKSHLTIVTATDKDCNPLTSPIFVNTKLAEHRAISLLCLDGAEMREFNTADNPAKLVAVYCIDYDSNILSGCEYWSGTEWLPLRGLNVQFVEEVEEQEESAADIFKRKFGVDFDFNNEGHKEMMKLLL